MKGPTSTNTEGWNSGVGRRPLISEDPRHRAAGVERGEERFLPVHLDFPLRGHVKDHRLELLELLPQPLRVRS